MKTARMCRLMGALSLLGLLRTADAGAGDARYRYVSLDNLQAPEGFAGSFFGFSTIGDDDRVYGNLCNDAGLCYAAVAEDGALKLLQPKDPGTQVFTLAAVRKSGIYGGSVSDVGDPSQAQAAILHHGTLEIVPASSGFSFVAAFTDSGAFVDSFDATFTEESFFFYEKGKLVPIDLSQIVNPNFLHVNRKGIIAGTQGSYFQNARGFRLDPRTGKITQLDPLPTEPLSWGLGINARGDVLGYSFISGQTERIGVWDREGRFQTYFVEGTAEFPTVSNRLLFNDDNLIAITVTSDGNSYIVPEPGVRLNLADITDNLPTTQFPLANVQAMNNRGSLAGYGLDASQFFLQRTDGNRHCEDDDDQGR